MIRIVSGSAATGCSSRNSPRPPTDCTALRTPLRSGSAGWPRSLMRTGLRRMFPGNREKYRENHEHLARYGADGAQISRCFVGSDAIFPKQLNRELLDRKQGNHSRKQGIALNSGNGPFPLHSRIWLARFVIAARPGRHDI